MKIINNNVKKFLCFRLRPNENSQMGRFKVSRVEKQNKWRCVAVGVIKTCGVTVNNESLSVCRLQVGNGPGSILHGQQSAVNYRLKSLEK